MTRSALALASFVWLTTVCSAQLPSDDYYAGPKEAARVTFAVIGDYGLEGDPEADVASRIRSWDVDLILTTGDNNYPDGTAETIDRNIGQYYADFIFPYTGSYPASASLHSNRFFPSVGNHDWRSITCTGASCEGPYFDYFSLPGNERYYDFRWGDVHFFAVNSNSAEPDGVTDSSYQALWLRGALESSDALWKVVYMHHAPLSSGSHGEAPRMQWPYGPWGADLVLAGHDHSYERIHRDGTIFCVNGLGGKSIYNFGDPVDGSVVRYNADYGAMLVTADPSAMRVQFIDRNGYVADDHTIEKAVSAHGRSAPEFLPVSRLLPAYPNPATVRTTVGFELTEPAIAGITVYDLLGREVTTIPRRYSPVGLHAFELSTADLPPGLYVYVLDGAATPEARILTVVR